MGTRAALVEGARLDFPGMACEIERLVGRGSNAFVYKGTYPDNLHPDLYHHVLVKELFPYHPGGAIYRDGDGRIARTAEGEETYAIHRLSFECGNQIHLQLLARRPDRIGANLNAFTLNNTLYTVLGYDGGHTLDEEWRLSAGSLRAGAQRTLGILDALEAFHDQGYLHLDISPDNVLIIGEGQRARLALIDYNSVHSLDSLRDGRALYRSAKEGYAAPEVHRGGEIGWGADLFSVAAVLYWMLTGAPPSAWQLIQKRPPDGRDSPLLVGMPDTVCAMVRQILRRGLQSLPARRYASIAEMRRDLAELIDRIDGVGVTHWALWEAGQRNAARIVRLNPSLQFLQKEAGLYPLRARLQDGTMAPLESVIAGCAGEAGGSLVIRAAGGMGKTTSLLRAAQARGQRYSSQVPALVYVSLYGGDGAAGIRDRILEDLRFKPDVATMDDARHALHGLLQTPIQTRTGLRPSVMILLDGLNEASSGSDALVREILELSQLAGVRMVVTTRSDSSALPFPVAELVPLQPSDVAQTLARSGLLPPEHEAMRELLRTPLLLSIFVKAALAGEKQLSLGTRDELIGTYLSVLCDKEARDLPQDSPRKWATEVAVRFVLPAICGELAARGRALTDAELLGAVASCWKVFASRRMASAFPEWIGHSADIRLSAAHAEEWYGLIVHDLLWRRMGLLVRDGQGRYFSMHQIVEQHLVALDAVNRRRLRNKRAVRTSLWALALTALICAGLVAWDQWIKPQPYDERIADEAVSAALSSYAQLGSKHERMLGALASARSAQDDRMQSALCRSELARIQAVQRGGGSGAASWGLAVLDELLASGDVLPGTGQPMDADAYRALLEWDDQRTAAYIRYLDVLDFACEGDAVDGARREAYIDGLAAVLAQDANLTDQLYHLACSPYLAALQRTDERRYRTFINLTKNYAGYGGNAAYGYEPWMACQRAQQAAQGALESQGIFAKYERWAQ